MPNEPSNDLSFALAVPAELNPTGVPIRVVGTKDRPLFVLADVCRVVGNADPSTTARRLDDDEKVPHIVRTPGGEQQMLCVSEEGLYHIALTARAENARPFRRWVTHEVLPCIRRHGCYPPPAEPDSQPLAVVSRFAEVAEHILGLGGMEERDRILLKDFVRTRLLLSGPGGAAQPAAVFVTIPERCVELGFARPKRGEDSEIGKRVARRYREKHGREPSKQTQWVDGRACRVNTYTAADLDCIDQGIRDYYESGGRRWGQLN